MKILRLALVAVLMLSVLPAAGFCADGGADHMEHCAASCPLTCCHTAVIIPDLPEQPAAVLSSVHILASSRSHPTPFIPIEQRPPIARS